MPLALESTVRDFANGVEAVTVPFRGWSHLTQIIFLLIFKSKETESHLH